MSAYEGAPAYRPEPGAAAGRRNGLGIAAVLLFWKLIGGIVLGLTGLVHGSIGFRRGRRGEATNGTMSLVGAILGALGVLGSLLVIGLGVSVINSDEFGSLTDCLKHAQNASDQQQCQQDYQDDVGG